MSDANFRETLTSDYDNQNLAHQKGAYEYLTSPLLAPRMGVVASYIKAFGAMSVMDMGCGVGTLRHHLGNDIKYFGIDISAHAIDVASVRYAGAEKTRFMAANLYEINVTETYDCAAILGIGYGMSIAGDIPLLISTIRNRFSAWLSAKGFFVFECILPYEGLVKAAISDTDIMARCRFECVDAPIHSSRVVFVVKAGAFDV